MGMGGRFGTGRPGKREPPCDSHFDFTRRRAIFAVLVTGLPVPAASRPKVIRFLAFDW